MLSTRRSSSLGVGLRKQELHCLIHCPSTSINSNGDHWVRGYQSLRHHWVKRLERLAPHITQFSRQMTRVWKSNALLRSLSFTSLWQVWQRSFSKNSYELHPSRLGNCYR